ncbi:MAG: efflux RND transporter permease subunit, partial [Pseudomonadota bacterium]
INLADVNDVIETAVGGKIASTIIEGQMRFAALVRFPEAYRNDVETLKRILVPAPEGPYIPLGNLATIREVESPAQISRENSMRRVVVECNIRDRDLGSFVAEAKEKLNPIAGSLPPGYFLKFGGQFENQQRAMERLAIVVPVSIALIFLMLFSAFGSLRSALLVFANLPFALVGGILAIFLLGINLSVSAAIGFIALFGIAVQNGTVLVTFFNQLRREGLSVLDAVKTGCDLRLRPLSMTTLCALLGVLPMLYATGSGSEIQRPLAAVVLGGLLSSQFLTLIVLPALYCIVESRSEQQEQDANTPK